MTQFILVIHVAIAMALVVLVLLQHGKGADAGAAFGSGASSTVFGAQGSSSFLVRVTTGLAIGFFVTSLSLAFLAARQMAPPTSVVDRIPQTTESAPAAPIDDGGLAPPPPVQ